MHCSCCGCCRCWCHWHRPSAWPYQPPIYVAAPPVVIVHQPDPAALAVRALSGRAA